MSTETANPILNVDKCSVLLLDIAGTTTSNSFLKETLFSYVDKQVETFLKEKWEDESVKEAIKLLKDGDLDQEAAVALVKELTEKSSDNKGLKTLQGLIYKKGYDNGELKAHVFPDVPSVLESWSKSRKVAIYSTGSVESQKLLFTHTTEGDLSGHITKYFDQETGAKTESSSYEKISKEFEVKPEEVVFVTDDIEEAKAAKTAGLVTSLISREGNDPLPEGATKDFPVITNFKEIVLEKSAKRKNEEDVPVTEEERPPKLAKTEENGTEETPAPVEEKMEVDTTVEKLETIKESTPKTDETSETKTEKIEIEPTVTEGKLTTEAKTDVIKTAEKKPTTEKSEEMKDELPKVEDKVDKDINVIEEEKMDTTPSDKVETEVKTVESEEPTSKPEEAETKKITEESKEQAETKSVDEPKPEEVKNVEKDTITTEPESKEIAKTSETMESSKAPEPTESQKTSESTESSKTSESTESSKTPESTEPSKTSDSTESSKTPELTESSKTPETTESPKTEEVAVSKSSNNVEVTETKTKSETVEEVANTGDNKKQEETNGEEKVEKENKSELANGVEEEVTNGKTTEEKQNGAASESPASAIEEIKVKKIDEAPTTDSTPPVSVEV